MLPSVNSSSLLLLIAVSITEPLFLPLTLVRNLELDSHFLSSSREHKRSRGAKHTSACESLPPFPSARQYQLLALPVAEFKSVHINRYLLNRIPIINQCHKPITTDFLRLCFVGNAGNIMKEAGPVSMTFDIPIYHALRLQVLQIAKKSKAHNPYRWVRYVTQANSYVAHMKGILFRRSSRRGILLLIKIKDLSKNCHSSSRARNIEDVLMLFGDHCRFTKRAKLNYVLTIKGGVGERLISLLETLLTCLCSS
ncbi:hypothetical protein Ahy_A07g035459 isoform A [Arachis hypogaea]|uniref:Uncharacterized protein n=1 Tax=Arachis hypogaea TaxID=3818 RepID=A0A445CDW7_ARAHY|nr:hypothetical protein Ahy_A07g035459 isoform A [Arachis hypogaea]